MHARLHAQHKTGASSKYPYPQAWPLPWVLLSPVRRNCFASRSATCCSAASARRSAPAYAQHATRTPNVVPGHTCLCTRCRQNNILFKREHPRECMHAFGVRGWQHLFIAKELHLLDCATHAVVDILLRSCFCLHREDTHVNMM
jgi:hypothetical protein